MEKDKKAEHLRTVRLMFMNEFYYKYGVTDDAKAAEFAKKFCEVTEYKLIDQDYLTRKNVNKYCKKAHGKGLI